MAKYEVLGICLLIIGCLIIISRELNWDKIPVHDASRPHIEASGIVSPE